MAIPLKYNLRSLFNRKISTALIILGISLVVMIFVSMMSMAQSMKQAIVQTGCKDNVIIKNKSTSSVEYDPEIEWPEKELYLNANRDRVNQILINLINNGLIYSTR